MYFYKPRWHSCPCTARCCLKTVVTQWYARKGTGNTLSNGHFLVPLDHILALFYGIYDLPFISSGAVVSCFHVSALTLLELESEDLFPSGSLVILLHLFTLFLAGILECLCAQTSPVPLNPSFTLQCWITVAACMEADLHMMIGFTGSSSNSASFVVYLDRCISNLN